MLSVNSVLNKGSCALKHQAVLGPHRDMQRFSRTAQCKTKQYSTVPTETHIKVDCFQGFELSFATLICSARLHQTALSSPPALRQGPSHADTDMVDADPSASAATAPLARRHQHAKRGVQGRIQTEHWHSQPVAG